MDDQAFITAIRAAPDENDLRLVYSDWLEENDQRERAELIRVQVALADPPEDWASYRALRTREAALLDNYGKKWFGPLKKLGVRNWVLRRGLVERVTMPAHRFLEHGEELLALAPIHSVKLSAARQVVGALAKCSHLARLTGLDLSGNKLREADVRTLLSPRLSRLRRLDLSDNPLGPGGVAALTGSPHLAGLQRLALRGVRMGFDGARALAGHVAFPRNFAASVKLAGLIALDIRQNEIYEEGVSVLARSPRLAGLIELSLTPSTGKSSEELNESRYLKNLTTLRISGGDFGEGFGLLMQCRFIKQLRILELNETEALDRQVERIADCRHLTQLEHLNLGGNRISDVGLLALASRGRMPRLRWLDLNKNQITSAGVQALCDSTLVQELRELNLADNSIDDDGARALAGCPRLSRLNGLVLSQNAITEAGAEALAGSPLLGQLEGLNLYDNPIGEKGASVLCRAAHQAGIPQRGGNDYWVDPQRSRRERFRESE